jgi:hypothetical protein
LLFPHEWNSGPNVLEGVKYIDQELNQQTKSTSQDKTLSSANGKDKIATEVSIQEKQW